VDVAVSMSPEYTTVDGFCTDGIRIDGTAITVISGLSIDDECPYTVV